MISDNSYTNIQGWMVNRLGLQGKELICYAIIYGYSKDEHGYFDGSRSYLCEWCGCTLPTIDAALSKLIGDGLIIKESNMKNGIIQNTYRCATLDENFIPYKTILHPYKVALHDNNSNNKEEEIIKESKKERKRRVIQYTPEFEKAFVATGRKGSKKNAFKHWLTLSDEDKEKVFAHIPFYYKSNDRQFLKDFEGYLNGRYFENVVYSKNGNILYDPDRENGNIPYTPICEGSLSWNDYYKCYLYVGFWDGHFLPDGYTDENRPDGASVMLHNGRGTIVWNKALKKWEVKK